MKGVAALFRPEADFSSLQLNPKLVYLEVHTPASRAMLIWAAEAKPANEPPIDTWASGEKEIMRTQAGFLVSSAGLNGDYWQNVKYQFNQAGLPIGVTFDMPSKQLYSVHLALRPIGPVKGNYTPLMMRAAKVPGVVFTAWQGVWTNPPASLPVSVKLQILNFIIGVDPKTQFAVYGLHCYTAELCVQYLLRTQAHNL